MPITDSDLFLVSQGGVNYSVTAQGIANYVNASGGGSNIFLQSGAGGGYLIYEFSNPDRPVLFGPPVSQTGNGYTYKWVPLGYEAGVAYYGLVSRFNASGYSGGGQSFSGVGAGALASASAFATGTGTYAPIAHVESNVWSATTGYVNYNAGTGNFANQTTVSSFATPNPTILYSNTTSYPVPRANVSKVTCAFSAQLQAISGQVYPVTMTLTGATTFDYSDVSLFMDTNNGNTATTNSLTIDCNTLLFGVIYQNGAANNYTFNIPANGSVQTATFRSISLWGSGTGNQTFNFQNMGALNTLNIGTMNCNHTGTGTTQFNCGNSAALSTVTAGTILGTGLGGSGTVEFNFNNCALTQTSLQNILYAVNAGGPGRGVIRLNGGTSAAPDATTQALIATVSGQGYSVQTN